MADKRTLEECERMLDRRDWEVHFWRWDFNELGLYTGSDNLLFWLPEEILDHVLPTNRTLRQHLELLKEKRQEILSRPERRGFAAFEQKLTPVQFRRKFDPLTGQWAYGNPEAELAEREDQPDPTTAQNGPGKAVES